MKSSRNAVIAFAFIPVVLAVTWFLFLRSPIPDIDQATADQLGAIADGWYPQWTGKTVPESEWPQAVKRLRPKSVRVTPEGVYIMKEQKGTEERGVFVHLTVSSFLPTPGGDPSYRLIRDRVYWYEING
jgi:hypothetical protein